MPNDLKKPYQMLAVCIFHQNDCFPLASFQAFAENQILTTWIRLRLPVLFADIINLWENLVPVYVSFPTRAAAAKHRLAANNIETSILRGTRGNYIL